MLNLILFILIFAFLIGAVLDFLNIRNWSPSVPGPMQDVFTEEKYKKAREYALVNYRFSTVSSLFSLLILIVALQGGLFGKLDSYVRTFLIPRQ